MAISKFLILKAIGKVVAPSQRLREWLNRVYDFIMLPYHAILIDKAERNHKKLLPELKKKQRLRVAFFVVHSSVWKLDNLYQMLEEHDCFEPIIVICPYIIFGTETMQREMQMAVDFFQKKGYRMCCTYNEQNESWIDIKKEVSPDIIYFTNPHNQTRKEYYIKNFLNHITCYSPYGFMLPKMQRQQFDLIFHNLLWRCFYETPVHKEMAQKYARNNGKNVVATGYPVFDSFLSWKPKVDPWKDKDKEVLRIIWAPHHTIEHNKRMRGYSNFLNYYEHMLSLLDKYEGKLQIAFKPHPGLRPKLNNHPDWGVKRTNEYFSRWANHSHGMLCEGNYIDLFMQSDALIHDSISFIAEFFFTGNPTLFLVRDNTIKGKFNEFGELAFEPLYKSYSLEDTIGFIEDVVINKNDRMAATRKQFLKKHLLPPNGKTASENIFQCLKELLG